MTTLVFDTEANGLLDSVTQIHCISITDSEGQVSTYHNSTDLASDGDLLDAVARLNHADLVVGHNIIGYDIPLLQRFFSGFKPKAYHDTYILSQMLFANEREKHGLEEYGKYYGLAKPRQEDWAILTEEMLHRNRVDTMINYRLWRDCQEALEDWDWSKAIALEYKVYEIFCKHQTHWYLDKDKCNYYIKVLERLSNLYTKKVIKLAPKQVIKNETVLNPFNKDGQINSRARKWALENNINEDQIVGSLSRIHFEDINLASTKQVTNWLLSIGWKPDTFNYKTDDSGRPVRDSSGQFIISSPSLRDSSFHGIDKHIQHCLIMRNKVAHRLNTIKGWHDSLYDSNKIKTFAYTCGTNTARFKHRGVVNVPKAEENVFFGRQMRSLFIAPKGYKLIGCDASQLEARIEGHFTHPYDHGSYAFFLLNEDIHAFNAKSWGLSRSEAKAPGYALAYQCSPQKVQQLLDCSLQMAQQIHQRYWDDRPSMKQLIEDLEKSVAARGQAEVMRNGNVKLVLEAKPWIKGIDGRKLFVRSAHSLKNTLIQNAGMIAMKVAYCLLAKALEDLDARICMFYHDEFQILVKDEPKLLQKVQQLAVKSIEQAGQILKLNIPLTGEAKIGKNWAGTH